jgi:chromosome segregation ATPase
LDTERRLNEDPFYKKELEKNTTFKHKIKDVDRESLEVNSTIQCLELANEFLINKKEETISERKKLLSQNDELKHEIEAKTQLNQIRIQKKMKENNSEELKKLDAHLKSVNDCIIDLEGKIGKEQDKSKMFISEILKLNIEMRHRQAKFKVLTDSTEEKAKELTEIKSTFEDLKNEHLNLKEKVIF